MEIVRVKHLADTIGESEEDVRKSLSSGWSTRLLALAGGVSANYLCKLVRRKKLEGVRIGRDWVVTKVAGDAWLAKRGVVVQ